MKRIMLLSAAVLALAGCKAGDPQLGEASIDKVLKAMTLEEKVHFVIGTGMAGFGGESAVVGATKNIVPGAAGTTYPIEKATCLTGTEVFVRASLTLPIRTSWMYLAGENPVYSLKMRRKLE